MTAAIGIIPKFTNLRGALNFTYVSAYPYLPLRLEDFVAETCDKSSLAAPQGCLITAEKIGTVPHKNRPEKWRVDYFVYHLDGRVVRHHPGPPGGDSMKPHPMRPGSSLFRISDAMEKGVGEALPVSYTHLTLPTNREV